MSHTSPWWFGYFLLNPVRRLVQPPSRFRGPFVRPGMVVVEPGCGMGRPTQVRGGLTSRPSETRSKWSTFHVRITSTPAFRAQAAMTAS